MRGETPRELSARLLLVALAQIARHVISIALAMNRRGLHSGWLGVAARSLTRACTRLYGAEIARRGGQ
jgi:hypothetical protein